MIATACLAFVLTQHAALVQEAARQYPKINLQNATATVTSISQTRNAETDTATQSTRISPDLCNEPAEQITATIAHELGHIITDQTYGAHLPKQQDEAMADQAGARLLATATKQDLLALLEQRCTTNRNYCDRAERWAYAFTH